jgi:predicted RNase H-like HicB family nuclease
MKGSSGEMKWNPGITGVVSPYCLQFSPKCVKLKCRKNESQSRGFPMEHVIQIHIEKLPEGMYLATSNELQGLIAQGRTVQETVEIARDVARKLLEAQNLNNRPTLPLITDQMDIPLIVGA